MVPVRLFLMLLPILLPEDWNDARRWLRIAMLFCKDVRLAESATRDPDEGFRDSPPLPPSFLRS